MPELKAIVTLMINKRVAEAQCSLCHETIIAHADGSIEEQESRLRAAIKLHAMNRHSHISAE